MANILDLKSSQAKKYNKDLLIDYLELLRLTKQFYNDIKPYFKHRIAYNLARYLLDFRDKLSYSIEILSDKVKEDTDGQS